MSKFNTFIKSLLVVTTLFVASCGKDLQDDVTSLKDRVTNLEMLVSDLEDAINSGKLITTVDKFDANGTTPSGWKITFSDNKTIDIFNGVKGDTPYVWINGKGNWATALNAKPADSDNAKYEIKVNGQSVKAYGTAVRTKNIDGYVGFEEYDPVSGEIKATVKTTIPYDHKNYITAIVDNGESVTFSIDSKDYTLAKAAVYPMSITVIRDRAYVIKGGTVAFHIAVNPSTNKLYEKKDFALSYEADYAYTRGANPDFIKIKSVTPSSTKGMYIMVLEWAESNTWFAKDAAIFIVLNFTDAKNQAAKVVSATPLIMNEEYVRLTNSHVYGVDDITMFSDEVCTDSITLINYHKGYINELLFTSYTPQSGSASNPLYIKPIKRYYNEDDIYKFSVIPHTAPNATVWPKDIYMRSTEVSVNITDQGRPAVPEQPAIPEIAQPAIPGIPRIPQNTVTTKFVVYVFRATADKVIYTHTFDPYWLPNATINYTPTVMLGSEISKSGYNSDDWTVSLDTQVLKKDGTTTPMLNNITPDVTKFNNNNNFTISYLINKTITAGNYSIELNMLARSNSPRLTGLARERRFKIILEFKIVNPVFQVTLKKHADFNPTLGVYRTNKITNVNISNLFDTQSTQMISVASDLKPARATLQYSFVTEHQHGALGIFFAPYPAVIAPVAADWGSSMAIKKPIDVKVKLTLGQEIPVQIVCKDAAGKVVEIHAEGKVEVQYDRLNLSRVTATTTTFNGNYSEMLQTGIDISVDETNWAPKTSANIELDPSMIKSIVYSDSGTVNIEAPESLPNGLDGQKVMTINSLTGVVMSIDGKAWSNPKAVLFQNFKVTYTDIWDNTASTIIKVRVKNNSTPTSVTF